MHNISQGGIFKPFHCRLINSISSLGTAVLYIYFLFTFRKRKLQWKCWKLRRNTPPKGYFNTGKLGFYELVTESSNFTIVHFIIIILVDEIKFLYILNQLKCIKTFITNFKSLFTFQASLCVWKGSKPFHCRKNIRFTTQIKI